MGVVDRGDGLGTVAHWRRTANWRAWGLWWDRMRWRGLLTINTLLTVGKHNTVSGITTPGHSCPSIRQQVISTH